jgi:hypothetical protein
MKALACLALLAAGLLSGTGLAANRHAAAGWRCDGPEVVIFDNTNGVAVRGGGTPASFTTDRFYCLTYLEHYHWNDGKGDAPGKIGLAGKETVGPYQALGSSGQGGARSVNHYVYAPKDPQVELVPGSYRCTDTKPATWSTNDRAKGAGFCIVKGVEARFDVPTPSGTTQTTATTEEPTGYDLSVAAAPVASTGEWAKDGSHIAFDTKITVANAPGEGSSPPTTMKLDVGATTNVLKTRLVVTGPNGACAPASCHVPALQPGKRAVYTIAIARATPALRGKVTIDLDVDCDQIEERTCANNIFPRAADGKGITLTVPPRSTTVTPTVEAPASADLSVTVDFKKSKSRRVGLDRWGLNWFVTVKNAGPSTARNVELLIVAPERGGDATGRSRLKDWDFYEHDGDEDQDCEPQGARTLLCRYAVLEKGKSLDFQLAGHPYHGGRYVVHARVRAATHDPDPIDNAVDDVHVLPEPG